MARIFISCNHRDLRLGKRIQDELIALGHVMTVKVDAFPVGRWEGKLLHGLHSADAVVAILTRDGLGSHWVVGQTGMAISCDYTRNQLVLPVCPGGDGVPNFVASFHCFWLRSQSQVAIKTLAQKLHEAIDVHRATQPPRVFISHRHKDARIAQKLVDLLRSAFRIQARDIRCTSLPGYRLAVGSQSAESLQRDLNGAEIVMGLIGPDTTESDYVLFELGAAWGLRKPTFPLRIAGATFKHVPEVLREKSSLSLGDLAQCLQLVEDVSRISSLTRKNSGRTGRGADTVGRHARKLVSIAGASAVPALAGKKKSKA